MPFKKTNYFNDSFFEIIDTEDKAYFLGLLFADGNVYLKRNRIQITLMNEDAYILEKFKEVVNSSAKLYIDREKYSKLILDSKKMTSDLIALGCTPNKSLTLKFPEKIPEHLIHHFVRGYFDGDGSIAIGKTGTHCSFTSTEEFLKELSEILLKNGIQCSEFKKRYKDREVSAGSIYIGKKESQKNLHLFLYNDCNDLYLNRKKEKFHKVFLSKVIRKCVICEGKYFGKGFCKKHYRSNYYTINKK